MSLLSVNMRKLIVLVLVVCLFGQITHSSFLDVYPEIPVEEITDDPGVPLILTPFIEQNRIQDALLAATVYFNGFKSIKSFAGYLTVDKNFNSNLFFWFFPALNDYTNAPVILWLQGGPGASSLIGLFGETGPFKVKPEKGLKVRPFSWVETHSVIYIDSPVGTGYSFTNGGYAQNETKVGEDLYIALIQFFTLFPELQKNEFFVAGESYGGKYVPAIAYIIHKGNTQAKIKINLQGISIGNGFCDPEHQINYGDYLYQLGLIDSNYQKIFQQMEQQGVNYIKNQQYVEAADIFDKLLNSDFSNSSSVFTNATGFQNYFNFLYPTDPNGLEIQYAGKYVQRSDVRAAIHVGSTPFGTAATIVKNNLQADLMQSVKSWISELLSNYRILFYNGQLDIIVAYPLTVNFLQNLEFNGADQYKTAKRYPWYVGTDLAGYVKQAGNLTEVLVRNAGHMVPADQTQWAFDLINRFTRNKPFQNKGRNKMNLYKILE